MNLKLCKPLHSLPDLKPLHSH